MKIFVKAKPGAFEAKIEKLDETHFVVAVREPPINGQANRAIQLALAEYFGIRISGVKIISGFTNKNKTVEISK